MFQGRLFGENVTNHLTMEILKRVRAFTLIELLIVITIIGILAVALVPRITGGPAKARDASRKADLQQIATALEFYADDNSGSYLAGNQCISDAAELGDYLTTVPSDPTGAVAPGCAGGYGYRAVSGGYLLFATLEGNATATGEGIYDFNFTFDNGITAAENMAASDLCGEDAADCPTNGAVYVVGR
jgi:prepilin-type N-terminal cleavage/methylation domain-containing protein